MSADEALATLLAGNSRYRDGMAEGGDADAFKRIALQFGQEPLAAVLTCADSRVVPELIFDVGIGDLFCVRVAGNVADGIVVGSLEYAVVQLGVRLVVVLGHESCGAVTAAVHGDPTDCSIDELITAIAPAVQLAKDVPGDLVDNSVRANARFVARQLRLMPPVLRPAASDGLRIVPAYYQLATGAVDLL